MVKRTVTALSLLAIAMPAILFGGIWFFLLIGFFIVLAAWEYTQMFRAVQMQPSAVIIVGGTVVLLVARGFFPAYAELALTCLVLIAMAVHLFTFERGRDQAAFDFAITVGGFMYLGWIGAYLYDLRALPEGGWWLMLVLPSVWMADTAAYVLGVKYGKHKMSPRLSPKKSWFLRLGLQRGYLRRTAHHQRLGRHVAWLRPQRDHHARRPGRESLQAAGRHQGFGHALPRSRRRV